MSTTEYAAPWAEIVDLGNIMLLQPTVEGQIIDSEWGD